MTDYVVRVQNRETPGAFFWTNGWAQTHQQMADLIQPVFKNALKTRVYIMECKEAGPLPVSLAAFPTIDPENENHIIVFVQTLSGANLFDFDFTLAGTEPLPEEP